MSSPAQPEVWLRGPVPGVPDQLQPVAHAILQAAEDAERLAGNLSVDRLWSRTGTAAPIAFHLKHIAGSMDRLFTYARGEALSESQWAELAREKDFTARDDAQTLLRAIHHVADRALEQLRSTPVEILDDPRPVGRGLLPSTIRGLLHHAGEHAVRHAGQISTLLKVMAGGAGAPDER